MKRIAAALSAIIAVATLGDVVDTEISQTYDTRTGTAIGDPLTWYQGASVKYSLTLKRGGTVLALPAASYPVWRAWLAADPETLYIAKTGTVTSASGGVVTIALTPGEANLPTGAYVQVVSVYNGGATNAMLAASTGEAVVTYNAIGAGVEYVGTSAMTDDGALTNITIVATASTTGTVTRTGRQAAVRVYTVGAGSGDITGVSITAGTGLTGTVSTTTGQHTQTLALNAASVASLAKADAAVQPTTAAYTNAVAQAAQGATAYGWGDHATAGYATGTTVAGAITSHTANASAHHVRYSDAEAVAALGVTVGGDTNRWLNQQGGFTTPGGGGDPDAWSEYPATQDVDGGGNYVTNTLGLHGPLGDGISLLSGSTIGYQDSTGTAWQVLTTRQAGSLYLAPDGDGSALTDLPAWVWRTNDAPRMTDPEATAGTETEPRMPSPAQIKDMVVAHAPAATDTKWDHVATNVLIMTGQRLRWVTSGVTNELWGTVSNFTFTVQGNVFYLDAD